MQIRYLNKSVIVQYIQIFLQEKSGLLIAKNPDYIGDNNITEKLEYYITMNQKINVTGYYDNQTYMAVALYMGLNYPEEGFPYCYAREYDEKGNLKWVTYPYGEGEYAETDKENYPKLCEIIMHNINIANEYVDVLNIDEKIVSYLLDEVVTPSSDQDEILRVQKLLYPNGISMDRAGIYDEAMLNTVKSIQKNALDIYMRTSTTAIDSDLMYKTFKNLRVTGFVDPWTELLIKRSIEEDATYIK